MPNQEHVDIIKQGAEVWNQWRKERSARLVKHQIDFLEGPEIDLSYTNLYEGDLRNANLSGVNLTGARLSWANLENADLHLAQLNGVDLFGANLQQANLYRAK